LHRNFRAVSVELFNLILLFIYIIFAMMNRIETLLNLLEQNPADDFTKYALALEYVSANETDNAERYLKDLIVSSPSYLATYYQYGKLLEDKGETDEARKIYNQGLFVASSQNDMHTKAELQDALDNLF